MLARLASASGKADFRVVTGDESRGIRHVASGRSLGSSPTPTATSHPRSRVRLTEGG